MALAHLATGSSNSYNYYQTTKIISTNKQNKDMKKINYTLILAFIALSSLFTACQRDGDMPDRTDANSTVDHLISKKFFTLVTALIEICPPWASKASIADTRMLIIL